jgi:hypothetical protein
LSTAEQAELTEFLNNGGNLIMVGQGIDNDISGEAFYGNYLHAATDNNQDGDRVIAGIAGNPISDGQSLLLLGGGCAGNGSVGPDRILPVGGATAVYNYGTEQAPEGVGAVMYDGAYKVVYCAFALEAACGLANTATMDEILTSIFEWMDVLSAPPSPDGALLPTSVELRGNYPNPFNPSTTVVFEVAASSFVNLGVFDVLGRQVDVLVNGRVEAGVHEVSFNGLGLASGVYLLKLNAGDVVRTSKMVLMK